MIEDSKPTLTADEWEEFVASEVASTCKAYLEKPAFLLGHSRTEKATTADYAGRELLELLQNAADAATENESPGEVLIQVTPEALYFANKGRPFERNGVTSLMTAHTSDKLTRAARMIGAKGLGFRAILNWTETPVVCSGNLELGFSRKHSTSVVDALAQQNDEIASQFKLGGSNLPPLLVFPAVGAALEEIVDAGVRAVLQNARQLRLEGYDTVIAVPVAADQILGRMIEQAREFEPSFLLFVPALKQISIRVLDEDEKVWTRTTDEDGDAVLQVSSGEETRTDTWIVRWRKDFVDDGEAKRGYELAIAIRPGEDNASANLHSFFPTSLPLPFAGLLHATLELDSSRKTISDNSDLNAHVLTALGRFYAETLDELRRSEQIDDPLSWLVPHQPFPVPLEPLSKAAWSRAQELPLIECMDGVWRTARAARVGPDRYFEFLPSRLFGHLANATRGVESLLRKELAVPSERPADVVSTLRQATLSEAERARAISGVARFLPHEHNDRRLLLDVTGASMPTTAIAFPPPSDDSKRHKLPRWARARFIEPGLWSALLIATPGNTLREKLYELRGFRIVEYSVDAVIGALRTTMLDLLKKGGDADVLQASFLATVYALHDRARSRPVGSFYVKCQNGAWHEVSTVHLADVYGPDGQLVQSLYSGHPETLIGTPGENGFAVAPNDLPEFLVWLGVNRWPRKVNDRLPEKWRSAVIEALPQKFYVTDGGSAKEVERTKLAWSYNVTATCDSVYALHDILDRAPSAAILAWISRDPRLDPLSTSPAFSVQLEARAGGQEKYRDYMGPLPSIIHREIQTTPWLVCDDSERRAPADVMLEPGVHAELFHAPRAFDASVQNEFGMDRAHWRRGLERAGVVRNLDDLPEAQVYRLLNSLPAKGVKPEAGGKLMLQVLERESFDPELGGVSGEIFRQKGMLPVQIGGRREWSEHSGVCYALRDDLPAVARSHIRLVDLLSRRNATLVRQRFGVPAFKKESLNLRVAATEECNSPIASDLLTNFEKAKPFVKALRKTLSTESAQLRRLERLNLRVASRVLMEFSIAGSTVSEELSPWRQALEGDDLIVAVDANLSYPEAIDLGCHAIADGLAELFGLQSGSEFVPFLAASTKSLRHAHLKRALPTHEDSQLSELLEGTEYHLASMFAPEIDANLLAAGPASPPTSVAPASLAESQVEGDVETPSAPANENKGPSAASLELAAVERPAEVFAVPADELPRVTLRVAAPTGRTGSGTTPDPDNAADAEDWTAAFEKGQGRWPELVAHFQGTAAFGCDYLSFDSEDDRAAFRREPSRVDLVSRFIETKSGGVRFTDNEWSAAVGLSDRYFIYKVSFAPGNRREARLAIVRNPAAQRQAIQTERELIVERVNDRLEFDLVVENTL